VYNGSKINDEVFSMTRMVRKQIYIPRRQQLLLKRKAKAVGISEAELIRQAIDRNLEGAEQRSFRRDPEAWEKAFEFMRLRQARGKTPKPYRWTREDAYEERFRRYDRKPK
jgi:hypothetical protein